MAVYLSWRSSNASAGSRSMALPGSSDCRRLHCAAALLGGVRGRLCSGLDYLLCQYDRYARDPKALIQEVRSTLFMSRFVGTDVLDHRQ